MSSESSIAADNTERKRVVSFEQGALQNSMKRINLNGSDISDDSMNKKAKEKPLLDDAFVVSCVMSLLYKLKAL